MTDFRTLPAGRFTLADVTVPGCLIGRAEDLVRTDVGVDGARLAEPGGARVEMGRAMVWPCLVDMHTHLDKGHIWARAPNPDGTFEGALGAVRADHANWGARDVRRRMDFALRCAHAHGTRAIRTHLDSMPPQPEISWPVFREVREEWAGRIDLQAVSLLGCDRLDDAYAETADVVAASGGVLGLVTYPMPDLPDRLRLFLAMAADRGLAVDLHVDETEDPASATLRQIADAVIETGFDARVVVGHCCSLATQERGEADRTLDRVAEAGLHVVSLPMCNLYLQDRHPGRTPRWRGVTLVHEMRERGIPVSFASDNTRDPFYAYGDLDMLEVVREATRIAHLDHSRADWAAAFTAQPAETCGFAAPSFAPGAPADLVICRARSWTELMARPQSDRIVLRGGVAVDRRLPDFAELDDLMELTP